MQALTETSVRQLLSLDETISPSDIEPALAMLKGRPTSVDDLVHVLRYKDAMQMLGVTRDGLNYYIRMGYLDRVFGSGDRAIGISFESYHRFTTRRASRISHS